MAMRIAVMMGGPSGEHEVSLASGVQVFQALKQEGWDPIAIIVELDGTWKVEEHPQERPPQPSFPIKDIPKE
ncbi:MAG: D-alanine--D-alanine ligase, partial [Firmicutes bacterium]|nr:D-alanine--D-alanine ligase [Bacillota bacterium]